MCTAAPFTNSPLLLYLLCSFIPPCFYDLNDRCLMVLYLFILAPRTNSVLVLV